MNHKIANALRKIANTWSNFLAFTTPIHDYPHQISFKGKVPEAEEIAAKRAEKVVALDGMSYEDVVKRMFSLTDVILELNTVIEKANREGHNLLFKEAGIKSKLSVVEYQINMEKAVDAESESLEYDYEHMDEKGNFKRVKVTSYSYPMLTDETFGVSLIGLKRQLNRELETVRDELTAFNATHKIDYELPEGIL